MLTQMVEGDLAGRLVPQDAYFGDATACTAEIKRMNALFGITDLILSGITDGRITRDADAALAKFASDVMPTSASGPLHAFTCKSG
jgi:hypothetical protein